MPLRERTVAGITIIDVEGPFRVADTPFALLDCTRGLLQRGDRRILLNLARIDRTDSAFLGELVESYRMTATQGGVLKIAQPTPHLSRQLKVTHFDAVIQTFATEADAIASFGAART
jgi:anti-sigma B factor antagonist